jgi:hypothetical protein
VAEPGTPDFQISQSQLVPSTAAFPDDCTVTPVASDGAWLPLPRQGASPIAANGYRFAKRQGKPNCQTGQ